MRKMSTFGLGIGMGLLSGVLLQVYPVIAEKDEPGTVMSGDVNDDGNVDISDAIYLLNWLYLGGPQPIVYQCDVPPPPPSNARFRLYNDLTCGGQPFSAVLELCESSVSDSYDLETTPSECGEFSAAATCPMKVSAVTAACGQLAICGSVPTQEGFVYDFVLSADGSGPLVMMYVQPLGVDDSCPAFPAPGTEPDGVFDVECSGDKRAGAGGMTWMAIEY